MLIPVSLDRILRLLQIWRDTSMRTTFRMDCWSPDEGVFSNNDGRWVLKVVFILRRNPVHHHYTHWMPRLFCWNLTSKGLVVLNYLGTPRPVFTIILAPFLPGYCMDLVHRMRLQRYSVGVRQRWASEFESTGLFGSKGGQLIASNWQSNL